MMLKAAFQGVAHGSARGIAWGTVLVGVITVFLMFVFRYMFG